MSSLGRDHRGLTDRKICVAVSVGVLLGAVTALLQFHGDSWSLSLGGGFSPLARARAEYKRLDRRLSQLNKDNSDLEREIERLTGGAKQDEDGGGGGTLDPFAPVQPGPAGTVRAPRTNPTLLPDRSVNPKLADILEDVHTNMEVLMAMGSSKVKELLDLWIQQVKRLSISNVVVVALDDEAARIVKEARVAVYRWDPRLESETEDGGFRVEILRDALSLGYSVLCSDLDVVLLRDPFQDGLLRRDSDVEGMSDGFDNATAYAYNDVTDDPSMGWARYAHTMRQYVINTGFMYVRPTIPALQLVDKVIISQRNEPGLDLVLFNFALWKPSSPGYTGVYASRRVLDYYSFVNSRVLFKEVRRDAWRFGKFVPAAVHINFHTDKYPRMLAIIQYYVNNQKDALDPFPDGNA